MIPFFSDKTINSKMNGSLRVVHRFFKHEIRNGWFYQSGPYVDRMFRFALKKIPKDYSVKQVLLLGLGGGGAVREVLKRFPKAHIIAIEYDSEMIRLCTSWYLQKKYQQTLEIRLGDAKEEIEKLSGTFDLILVDLFVDSKVSSCLSDNRFIERIGDLLKYEGYLLANFFNEEDKFLPMLKKRLSCPEIISFRFNIIGLFRHVGQGTVGDILPKEFIHKGQSKQYTKIVSCNTSKTEMIGEPPTLGVRSHLGPLYFESYTTDTEPIIEPIGHPRIIVWQPLTKTNTNGWIVDPFSDTNNQNGFAILKDGEYWKEWSHHAQRHRTRFIKDDRFFIKDVGLDVFADAYHATHKLDWLTRTGFVRVLRHHIIRHPKNVHLFVACEKSTEKIVAGLAVIDYHDISQSMHTIAFMHPSVHQTSVGFGLIDHWYKHAQKNGIICLNFGLVWCHGNPSGWKGYSKFKRQFHLHLLRLPKTFVKITLC